MTTNSSNRPTWMIARRVLLVEDEGILRGLLEEVLTRAGYDVVACATASAALRQFDRFDPDALVTDIDLGSGGDGITLATALLRREPSLAIVVLSAYGIASDRKSPLHGRARYLNKTNMDDIGTLLVTLESALRDEPLGPEVDPLATTPPEATSRVARLTRRQREVLRMIAAGLTNAEIAERRGISVVSVEHIIRRMHATLGLATDDATVNPRVSAARLYYEGLGGPGRLPSASRPDSGKAASPKPTAE